MIPASNNLEFRLATTKDIESIAALHTESWQLNYRGDFREEYLNGPIIQERLSVWTDRLTNPPDNQFVLCCIDSNGALIGFSGCYAHKDSVYGNYMDNLHVAKEWQRKGIGVQLMHHSFYWSYQVDPQALFYLWVLKNNTRAIAFYEKMGGENVEHTQFKGPDGGISEVYRIVWKDLPTLAKLAFPNGVMWG